MERKYISPELRIININAKDIIQVSEVAMPNTIDDASQALEAKEIDIFND